MELEKIICPKCGSENVVYDNKTGEYVCRQCSNSKNDVSYKEKFKKEEKRRARSSYKTSKKVAVCGIFGALATILYVIPVFKFPLPFLFPSFLEFNFSDIPTLIAGFTYGPIAAILVHVVKILIKLPMSSTACVGELADFIIGLLFVLPAVIYYRKDKTKRGAIIGLCLSLVIATSVACIVNRYITIPFFTNAFGMNAVLGMAQAANPNISDVSWSLVLWGVLPFNFVKNVLMCVLSFLLYKKISNVINKYGAK